ncbi:MAG: ABC transporter permease [Acidobacteria bacterium]|nr:ABC transporter permease [Acidobacteriota bacterium]
MTVNLLPLLGVRPAIGRTFEPADQQGERPRVALLSHFAWQHRVGGVADVVGRTIRMDRHPVTIVGVMPASFRFPSTETEMWVPLVLSPDERRSFGSHFMSAIGRLKPGVTLADAADEMKRVADRLVEFNPPSRGWDVLLFDLHDYTVDGVRQSLYVLLGAVAFVLLIACANVANLLLARGAARPQELAIRSSIGATRGRLLRQLAVEQLALALASALAGVLLAAWLLRVLLAMLPEALPAHVVVGLDARVLGFALLLAVFTPVVFGLLPAIHASRPDLRTLMSGGGRQGTAIPARRMRNGLVVAEIALAMTLLVGVGLLIRSFAKLTTQSPGFNAERALLAGVSLPTDKYATGEPRERFLAEFLEQVGRLPTVAATGISMPMPMVNDFNSSYEIEGDPQTGDQRPVTLFYAVTGGIGMPCRSRC